jgi:hypothetical protein
MSSLPHGARRARRRLISKCEEQTVEEEPTCGRGLAQSAAVPAKLAVVAAGLARNLEVHTRALDLGDAAGVQERDVYERVARSLHGAAADLEAAAAEMAAAVDMPMAAHDMAAMTTREVLDIFTRHVAAEEDLRRLLEARRADNEAMLTAIRAEIESSEPDTGMRAQDS